MQDVSATLSSDPLLTISLPFYNAQATLESALRSVFCQTFSDWELVLINDGSTDESAAIARTVEDDPRVTFIDGTTNRELPRRLNQIAQLARGEFLARMDADDLMHPDRLRRQLEVLRRRPEVDVVGTAMFIMDHQGTLVGLSRKRRPNDAGSRLRYTALDHPTVTGRTAWFRSHPYDERYPRSQDYELWVRAGPTSVFCYLDSPLHFYRQDQAVIPQGKYTPALADHLSILREHRVSTIGRARTVSLILQIRVKGLLYRVLRLAHRPALLDRLRYRRVPPKSLEEGRTVLAAMAAGASCERRHR